MTIEDDIALLSRVPTFSALRPEALRLMAIGAESKAIAAEEVLFAAGEVADCGFVIESGSIKLTPTNRSPPVIASRGALLGELALLSETHRPATAVAREPSMVMRIARPLFLRMLEGYPDIAERLRQEFLARTENLAEALHTARYSFRLEDVVLPVETAPDAPGPEPATDVEGGHEPPAKPA
jgi:CRP-like cAMP-binding protein